ncbi:unnamed protein product [Sympodiomycopsis kandeliae]
MPTVKARKGASNVNGKHNDGNSSEDEGPSTALTSFTSSITVLKSKRRRIETPRGGTRPSTAQDPSLPGIEAFPRLSQFETTDRPRNVRRRAYLQARQWLHNAVQGLRDAQDQPHIDRLTSWIETVASQERSSRFPSGSSSKLRSMQGIPTVILPADVSFSRLRPALQQRQSESDAWHIQFAAEASTSDAKSIIAKACRQWLQEVCNEQTASTVGCPALWARLARVMSTLENPPSLILALSEIPPSPLFSTLSYLLGSTPFSPSLMIILQYQPGPMGIESLLWEEKRCLDVQSLAFPDADHLPNGENLVKNLFLHAEKAPPLQLPPEVLELAIIDADAHDFSDAVQIVDLALQRAYTQHTACAFLVDSSDELSAEDFQEDFFTQIRRHLIHIVQPDQALQTPNVSFLPPALQQAGMFKSVLQDDEQLFAALSEVANADASIWRNRTTALDLLRAVPSGEQGARFKQQIDTLGTMLLTCSPEKLSTLRKRIGDVLAPALRSIRRSDSEEGGLPVPQLEQWLDRLEDWEQKRTQHTTIVGENSDARGPSGLLHQVRCFQQELHSTYSVAQANGTSSSTEVKDEESSRLSKVEDKLKRDEALRDLRGRIADWFASEVRTRLRQTRPTILDSLSSFSGRSMAVAIESLLFPSPRSHAILALSRPQLFLQHYADCHRSDAQHHDNDGLRQAVQTLQRSLGTSGKSSHDEVQTDVSLAFNLLREAGGPGTGVRGRMINLYDWYQAWLSSSSRTTGQEQARFALALSTLAMLGFIRKTRKGNGELVLKVGGWDIVPGLADVDVGQEAIGRDADLDIS